MDPDRPVSSLLKMQIDHFQEAEKRLPFRHHSGIYTNAIKTEREAAVYIRSVTEAIYSAHQRAERARSAPEPRRRGLEIAAAAESPSRDRSRKRKKPGNKKKTNRKK